MPNLFFIIPFERQALHYATEEQQNNINIELEYPFLNLRKSFENLGNTYKRIKICKTCFIIYSLVQRHNEAQLKRELRQEESKMSKTSSMPRLSMLGKSISQPKDIDLYR